MSDNNEKFCSSKLKKSISLGVLVVVAVVGWHIYEYLIRGKIPEEHETPAEHEIYDLTQRLFEEEEQQQNSYLAHVNFQHRTRSHNRDDQAPQPLLQVRQDLVQAEPSSTHSLLIRLFDNYDLDTMAVERVTAEHKQEQTDFLNAILKTPIMRRTMKFLVSKGKVSDSYDSQLRLLQEMWFTQYSRGQGRLGSSGFEHVFLAEIRDQQSILGLHNWIYFSEQEVKGNLDYKGYIKRLDFGKGDKHLVAIRFTFFDIVKPFNTLFVGTSPELEMSLYTVCFLLSQKEPCPVQLGKTKFNIITHAWDWHGKKLIASAYPSIDET